MTTNTEMPSAAAPPPIQCSAEQDRAGATPTSPGPNDDPILAMLDAAERGEGVHRYDIAHLPWALREGVISALRCESEPHVIADAIGIVIQSAAALSAQSATATFQARVGPWMQECFGQAVSADRLERGDRLLEEVFELLQSGDYPPARVAALVGYVWNRPTGEPAQEVGGVMVTLAAYCLAHALDMHEAAETELARIWTKVPQIRAKQATKAGAIGNASPLPVPPPIGSDDEGIVE